MKKMNKFVEDLRAAGAEGAVPVPEGFGLNDVRFAVEKAGKLEPPVFCTDGPRADLAIAYPLSDQIIGFTLTVAGKPQKFEMTRSAAAHFAGRIAEALAK